MYSCSSPNHVSSPLCLSKYSAASQRVLVGRGTPAGVVASQRTSRLDSFGRKGSRYVARGLRITSESSPGAWPVELPSKFHRGSDFRSDFEVGRVRVLERVLPAASIQMYSARKRVGERGREEYLLITVGSRELGSGNRREGLGLDSVF